jgi:hypothetical protein
VVCASGWHAGYDGPSKRFDVQDHVYDGSSQKHPVKCTRARLDSVHSAGTIKLDHDTAEFC